MAIFAKRHYEAVARAMQEARLVPNEDTPATITQWEVVVMELANTFRRDNGAFDRERFERACQPGNNVRART